MRTVRSAGLFGTCGKQSRLCLGSVVVVVGEEVEVVLDEVVAVLLGVVIVDNEVEVVSEEVVVVVAGAVVMVRWPMLKISTLETPPP